MKIDRILAGIRDSKDTSKTASANTQVTPAPVPASSKTAAPREALLGALNDTLGSAKTAAEAPVQSSPVSDVLKIAQELAASESEAAKKEAEVLGKAFMNGAIAEYNSWQKTAAALPAAPQMEFASAQGYSDTRASLEKQAEDAYVDGFNNTVMAIHKTASLEFLKAAQCTGKILDTLAAR